jgi:hypothetical protein
MIMVAIPVRINIRSFIKLGSNHLAAFHRSTGVRAKTKILNPAVITHAVGILIFQTYYLIRLLNSRSMSLATLIVLALAWKPFWA